jgi:hypothetical protein
MKTKIIKFLIKKNGFYDRERLIYLSERKLTSILICKIYRAYLKAFCRQKKVKIAKPREQKHHMELISEQLGHINIFSRIKFKITKKYGK